MATERPHLVATLMAAFAIVSVGSVASAQDLILPPAPIAQPPAAPSGGSVQFCFNGH